MVVFRKDHQKKRIGVRLYLHFLQHFKQILNTKAIKKIKIFPVPNVFSVIVSSDKNLGHNWNGKEKENDW